MKTSILIVLFALNFHLSLESIVNEIFQYSNYLAMAGWVLLIAAPRRKVTDILVHTGLLPFVSGIAYIILYFAAGDAAGGYGSLSDVYELFSNRLMLLAGWIHYLGFDLFIGSWEVKNAQKYEIHHLFIVPCLTLTFFVGPVGLALFFLIRTVKTKQFFHENFK